MLRRGWGGSEKVKEKREEGVDDFMILGILGIEIEVL